MTVMQDALQYNKSVHLFWKMLLTHNTRLSADCHKAGRVSDLSLITSYEHATTQVLCLTKSNA